MPKLVRFLALNCLIGVAASWVTLAALIATDTLGLGTIIFSSSEPFLPLGLLAFGFAIAFGSAAMGAAVLMMADGGDRDCDDGGGGPVEDEFMMLLRRPVRVRAKDEGQSRM